MRVCTLKDGQVIDKKGNVVYTLKHKGPLTAMDALELLQLSIDLDISIITASQKPKESSKLQESDSPEVPRIYGHKKPRKSLLTPEQLEQLKVSVEAVTKSVPLDPEDWRKDSQEEDI